ncbi:MAG: hypothetical protein EOO77_35485 [Oxalobacteraceae bacterium]|nr:MAG: hypothetical protein EOO77_35485 [Oxalobacteraceae bacterium]
MRAWWIEGRLCLTLHGNDAPCVDLARGPVAELILAALALSVEKQVIAWIEFESDDGLIRLSRSEILKLSSHPDFPIII